ncbi:MAG TPA: beta-1,6-N-acetylglucosaminyltransferase [Devosia sp.]|nr:beta-1,6-N-acetylglucosaminyltransferase [Devosia sp.]
MAADIAFLIMAHDRPEALSALLDDLAGTGQPVFLHVDRTARRFDAPMSRFADRAVCLPRRKVIWGGYSQLQAILALLEAAHAQSAARYFMLLSNACVPVRPYAELSALLAGSDREFIDQFTRERAKADNRIRRLDRYYLMRKRIPRFIGIEINKLLRHVPRRPFAEDFGEARFGGTWWALSRDFVDWLLAFRKTNPGFDQRFRMTQFSDEAYFQTALGLSPFADRIAPSLTYADWTDAAAAHPKMLDRSDLPAIDASGRFFARKYLRESDPDLTAELSARWRG